MGSPGSLDKSEVSDFGAQLINPIGSMYGIFTYIWVIYGVNVGKYSIHGSYGNETYSV